MCGASVSVRKSLVAGSAAGIARALASPLRPCVADLPLLTWFDQGCGRFLCSSGRTVSRTPWHALQLQTALPPVMSQGCCISDATSWNGGSCVRLEVPCDGHAAVAWLLAVDATAVQSCSQLVFSVVRGQSDAGDGKLVSIRAVVAGSTADAPWPAPGSGVWDVVEPVSPPVRLGAGDDGVFWRRHTWHVGVQSLPPAPVVLFGVCASFGDGVGVGLRAAGAGAGAGAGAAGIAAAATSTASTNAATTASKVEAFTPVGDINATVVFFGEAALADKQQQHTAKAVPSDVALPMTVLGACERPVHSHAPCSHSVLVDLSCVGSGHRVDIFVSDKHALRTLSGEAPVQLQAVRFASDAGDTVVRMEGMDRIGREWRTDPAVLHCPHVT